MDTQLIDKIITGAPNFIGFAVALFLLYRRLVAMDKLVLYLTEQWANCESDEERKNAQNLQKK